MIGKRRSRADLPWWANLPEGVMPFNPELMKGCVRVIGDKPDRRLKTGRRRGAIGSGFLLSVASETRPEFGYIYVVTADHVIEGQSFIEVQAPDPLTNGELYDPVEVKAWHRPLEGVDLAVALFPTELDVRAISMRSVLPQNASPFLGSEVFYVGVLEPLDRPMARRGTVGAVDQLGIPHDGGYDYPCHLIDCRSYGGFSGSPCFLHSILPILVAQPDPEDATYDVVPLGSMRHTCTLIGLIGEHLEDKHRQHENDDVDVASRYGVATVVRAREIRKALMTDEMRDDRKRWDEINAAKLNDEGPSLQKTAAYVSDENEYDRFEELARLLVNKPKPTKDKDE